MKFDIKKLVDEALSKDFWYRALIMVVSMFVLAVNYNTFLLPNNFVIGGTSGITTIVHHFTGIDPATFVFIFNAVFIVLALFLLGSRQTGLSLIGSLVYPFFVSITSGFCAQIAANLHFDSFILTAIISAVLFGSANGFIYKTGFSTGGIDILFQIINKYFHIPTGNVSFMVNIVIIVLGGVFFGIEMAIYAILVIFINSTLIDKIMLGISESKVFYIHTTKTKEVQKAIVSLGTGYTVLKSDGSYDSQDNDIIMCVITTKDYYLLKNIVQRIDPLSFFIITDCYQAFGGYRKEKYPFM
ncbi:MAG: YitT family protein [Candidatus Coprovivens sp.]